MAMKKRMFIAAGLIGLPVITWALLAWEPFDRLLARFFPEMFYDEVGRFVPYTPFDALLSTILLAVYPAVPIALILLVCGVVQSVRRRGAAGTAIRAGRIVYRGSVVVLVAVWSMVLMIVHGVRGFLMFLMSDSFVEYANHRKLTEIERKLDMIGKNRRTQADTE